MFDHIRSTIHGAFDAIVHPDPEALPSGSTSPVQAGGLTAPPQSPVGQFLGDLGHGLSQEGLSGLLDPAGMIDRQRAQRELADRFQVVRPGAATTAENQVTQEQFQEIARTYSDIRRDRTDIHFNTEGLEDAEAAAFRTGSMNDLASILQTSGGRTLIDRLAHQPSDRTTTLSPLFHQNAAGDYDASLGRDNGNGYAAPDGDGSHAYRNTDGTAGVGVDSRVRMNPGQSIAPADADLTQDRWLPWRSDVLLYHELVHSMDQTYGTMDPTQAGADGDGVAYDQNVDRSEHRAAGLGVYAREPVSENAYRTARRAIGATNYGERAGDDTMPDRSTYFYHGLPAPPPDGGGSPGTTTRRDPHGHEHDPHHHP
ncbi:MAG: M91 family zinc metallopeptidase [Kofleriaceae bacterium]